ncbi:TetR family transcriptional regulator, partial [Mesorhizobium sp. M1C.F.Ca.ET.188.01.1.1]
RNPDYVEAAGRAAATLVRARMSVSQMQG